MTSKRQTEAMLIKRAADKLVSGTNELVASAQYELRKAGSWKDEVRLDVFMHKAYCGTRCARLLHGVPSPRFWASPVKNIVSMPAKDVVYFFAPSQVIDLLPDLHSESELAHWLGSFSSTRFEDQLIQALIGHARVESSMYSHPSLAYRVAALAGAKIDEHAWFTSQKSMTLANSAPVWRPKKKTG